MILVDETKQYEIDEVIEEKDIESYFVWIPRYRYKLKADEETYNTYKYVTNFGNANYVDEFYKTYPNQATNNAFEIEFENIITPPSVTTEKDQWLTHPAFISFNCNGFWVGKFETGYKDANSITNAEVNAEESNKVIIKPNVYSWRGIEVSNAFYTSYNYKRELESHMMKNSEWGAVAYLTNSKYGRCTNGICEEVRINNSSNFITGASNKDQPICGYTGTNEDCNHYENANLTSDNESINNYLNQESGKSSTTGNHTGIYDMSGGAWDYVMGVMQAGEANKNPASGRSKTNNSGFNGIFTCPTCDNESETVTSKTDGKNWPSSKYYDLYDYKTMSQEYHKGILGDGTKEIGPFYSVNWPKTGGSYFARNVGSYNADLAYFANFGNP